MASSSLADPVVILAPAPEREPSQGGAIPAETPANPAKVFETVARRGLQAI